MIGSTFSQMANAEKLSPQQLQLAIQHGTIPSYIGIPLLQEKLKQDQEAKALAGGQQKPPTIAQQVMQQAQAQQGVEALPSGLPAEAMAGGGIVAFADGGIYEDDDDSYEERMDAAHEADLDEAMKEAMDAREELGLAAPAKDSYTEVRSTPSGDKYEALALEKNKAHGVDERLLRHVMHKETGGMKDRANAVSHAGAQGVMQLMPATAKDLGVRDPFNPEQNIEGGVKYLAQLERKYHDPKLAAMAYNWGTGNVDKWLMAGADMSKLPRETRGYVQGLAKGGEVQGFAKGDLIYNPETNEYEEDVEREGLGAKFARLINYGKGLTAGENMPGMAKAKEQVAEALAKRNGTPIVPKFDAGQGQGWDNAPVAQQGPATPPAPVTDIGFGEGNFAPTGSTQATAPAAAPSAPSAMSDIEELMKKRYENIDKQREQDKYMALLSAGLGMMGGTSPNALANIAAGGAEGVKSLAAANAARTAEENALLSGRLGLAKIGSAREQALAAQQLRKEIFGAQNKRLSEASGTREEDKIATRLANTYKNAEAQAEKNIANNSKLNFAPNREALKQEELNRILRGTGTYIRDWKKLHGPDEDPFAGLEQSFGAPPEGAVKRIKG